MATYSRVRRGATLVSLYSIHFLDFVLSELSILTESDTGRDWGHVGTSKGHESARFQRNSQTKEHVFRVREPL